MEKATRPIRVYTEAADRTLTPFDGTGIRVAFAPSTWLQVDFKFGVDQFPIAVVVAARSRREPGDGWPRLSLDPYAGNVVSVHSRVPRPATASEWKVIAVRSSELEGDVRKQLAKLSPGDPLGDWALSDPDRARLDARAIVIEYGDIDDVRIEIERPSDSSVTAVVRTQGGRWESSGESREPSLWMWMQFHGANMVWIGFHEA